MVKIYDDKLIDKKTTDSWNEMADEIIEMIEKLYGEELKRLEGEKWSRQL